MTRLTLILLIAAACGGDEGVYAPCDVADDCIVPEDTTAECLDKSGVGFCSWECAVDDDCSPSPDAWDYVCASFESESGLHCFPSCEDDAEGCPDGTSCRSTGGGSDNRKVCFPGE